MRSPQDRFPRNYSASSHELVTDRRDRVEICLKCALPNPTSTYRLVQFQAGHLVQTEHSRSHAYQVVQAVCDNYASTAHWRWATRPHDEKMHHLCGAPDERAPLAEHRQTISARPWRESSTPPSASGDFLAEKFELVGTSLRKRECSSAPLGCCNVPFSMAMVQKRS